MAQSTEKAQVFLGLFFSPDICRKTLVYVTTSNRDMKEGQSVTKQKTEPLPRNGELRNAVIERGTIHIVEGHVECSVVLKYGDGFSQCAYVRLDSVGHLLKLARVKDFANLKGQAIRVRADMGRVWAIGDIIEDEWLDV